MLNGKFPYFKKEKKRKGVPWQKGLPKLSFTLGPIFRTQQTAFLLVPVQYAGLCTCRHRNEVCFQQNNKK